ncbi:MAG: hypothetical protein M3Y87_28735 [Myxococcota bacterium]|nr:hypothetical protein [Myxococcota bacterium]
MKPGKAFIAGVVGGAVMSVLLAIGRAMGMPINLEMMLGTMTGLAPGAGTWVLGLIMHLVISGGIALFYAVGFEHIAHRAGALPGVVFSLLHIVVGGLVMGFIPAIHPLIPESMMAPGAFMSNIGDIGVIAFVALHAIYGAVVGVVYGPVVHPAATTTLGRPFDRRAAI